MSDPRPALFDLTYRLRPVSPRAHLFAVEIDIAHPPAERLMLSMPAWIPGSYMIRDFARNLLAVTARTAQGQPLTLDKLDKQTWICDGVTGAVTIAYRVFAWELSVRAAHLDTTHAYFNGASLLARVHGLEDRPCRIELLPPEDTGCSGWRVATSLRPLDAEPLGFGSYQADDYEDLIDHPVEMGAFGLLSFAVRGVPHRVAITGRHRLDEARLIQDLTRICAQQAALFGELPIDRYLFLLTVVGDGYGGLEHRFSSSLICPRDDLPMPGDDKLSEGYKRLLGLFSHEYFHLWQVKRIRPQAFRDGGLEREVHTRQLWAFEGITAYYDELVLARSGCLDHKTYFGLLAATITRVMRTPGRHVQTLAEASFDAWTKFYKADENAPNALVSYYAKGALVALALDLTIRRETGGAHSLDEVMRELWRRHGRTGKGVPERGVEAVASAVSGLDLTGFFAQALDSTEDLDLAALLATVGVEMRLRPNQGPKDLGGCVDRFETIVPMPALDVRLRPGGPDAVIQNVIAGGAGECAGLAPGDLLLAVDGLRATADNLERLVARAAGQPEGVSLHLFRRDELMTLTASPRPATLDTCELMPLDPVSEPGRSGPRRLACQRGVSPSWSVISHSSGCSPTVAFIPARFLPASWESAASRSGKRCASPPNITGWHLNPCAVAATGCPRPWNSWMPSVSRRHCRPLDAPLWSVWTSMTRSIPPMPRLCARRPWARHPEPPAWPSARPPVTDGEAGSGCRRLEPISICPCSGGLPWRRRHWVERVWRPVPWWRMRCAPSGPRNWP